MLFWVIVKVGIKSLWSNKLRSLLAMLGIIIGVGAVISMLAMGAGARRQIMERISAMGTNLLVVRPGQRPMGGVVSGTSQKLTLDDAQAIAVEVSRVARVAPAVEGNAQAKYLNKNVPARIVGTSATYLEIRGFQVERGRAFTESEVDNAARVALLGPVTASDLFGQDDPIAQTIKLKGIDFSVVGVLKSKGAQGPMSPDEQIILPYTVAMKQVLGVDRLREINVQAASETELDLVQSEVTTLLRKRHRTPEGQTEDFRIFNQAEIIETQTQFSDTFTILLGSIASISLVVGGIGIMNIMLVSVTERTREIGIRKAIGARRGNILLQFLIEAIIISGLGGMIGVGLGTASAKIIGSLTQFATVLELPSMLLALSFSGFVGVFFGWYPARRAAALSPVEALRYE